MPRRQSSRPEPQTVRAILDFGTGGTRAAVVRLSDAGAQVMGMGQTLGASGIARPGHVMQRRQISALAEQSLAAAETDSATAATRQSIADDALVGLTGPFLHAHPATHHITRRRDVPLYAAELRLAMDQAQRQSLQALAQTVQSGPLRRSLVGSQLVGAWMVQSEDETAHRLTSLPDGAPSAGGDTLSIMLCNLSWPTQGLAMVRDVLDDLELGLHSVVPQAQAVAAALPRPNAILVDVGAEHTEITLVEARALSDLTNVSLGGDFFTQRLMQALSLPHETAQFVKHRAAHARVAPNSAVVRALHDATARWRFEVEEALRHLAHGGPLPPLIYLFGGGAQLPTLLTALRDYPWLDHLPFERHPEVERLAPYQLEGLNDPRGLLHSSSAVGLAALTIWAARAPAPLEQQLDEVTGRLVRTLPLG